MATIAPEAPRVFRITTPEGFVLPFEVAPISARVLAFLVDFALVSAAIAALWIAALVIGAGTRNFELAAAIALVAHFVLRQGYFLLSEARRGGTTLGKRLFRLRVLSRDGGPLPIEAVVARNLLRDFETFLPLVAILAPQALVPAAPGWGRALSTLWLVVFAALPFLSTERLRCGDLVAGTLVARAPRPVLLPDLSAAPAASAVAPASFTREQLDIYGIHELQVLEKVLRQAHEGSVEPILLDQIAARIRGKIGWPAERAREPALPFLEAFYRAQRGRLEHHLLLGQRRERAKGKDAPP